MRENHASTTLHTHDVPKKAHMERPIHWRAPHKPYILPQDEVEIFAPPPAPTPPELMGSIIALLPLIAMFFVLLVAAQVMGSSVSWLLFSIPMMGLSAFSSFYMDRRRKRKYEQDTVLREQKYREYLYNQQDRLRRKVETIRETLKKEFPAPDELLQYVQKPRSGFIPERRRRLWERMPQDEDFLTLRVGIGTIPSPFSIRFQGADNPLDDDPLLQSARALREAFSTIQDTVVTISLSAYPRFGVAVRDTDQRFRVANALLLQLVAFHAPSEVQIALFCDQIEAYQWKWIRWLPHVHEQGSMRRFIAADETKRAALAQHLEHILEARKQKQRDQIIEQNENNIRELPVFILLVTNPRFILENQSLTKLLLEGPAFNFFFIVLGERERELPALVRSSIHIGKYTFLRRENEKDIADIRFDEISSHELEDFARLMAPLQDPALSSIAEIPSMITLFDLLHIQDIPDLEERIDKHWDNSLTRLRHLSAPLGQQAGQETLEIDLHERAHGPNGLVAGMVGAGKSELLQTLVISLALRYHPHQLAFVLIDYKGGGMAEPFRKLPHTLGIITNLQDPNLAERAIKSLEVEMRRRQDLFNKADVNHIDDYHRRRYEEKDPRASIPLPYLVVIVDEFAEMKTENPDLAREFIRIARLGRALGLRLILAMQKPAGIVDSQIEANTRFRLCLRVAQIEDSRTMLRRPDAAYIKQTGRAFFQVGVNEIFSEFQVAWSGAPYTPGGVREDDLRVFQVDLDGERIPIGSPLRLPFQTSETIPETQLDAVLQFLEQFSKSKGTDPLPKLWSEPLPTEMFLEELLAPAYVRWNEHKKEWMEGPLLLRPIVGKIDDPTHPDPDKRQRPLQLSLEKDGSIAIYGSPGIGKTEFITTMLTSLALKVPPTELHVYILDCGGGELQVFEKLPHVGAFILNEEKDRHIRLFRLLSRMMEDRRKKFLNAGVNDIYAWWNKHSQKAMPAILLVIDNFAGFKEAYQDSPKDQTEYEKLERMLLQLIRDGRRFGIHVLISAMMHSDLKLQMRAAFGRQITFRLQDSSLYSELLGVRTRLQPAPVPGRGLIAIKETESETRLNVYEFQTALATQGETKSERRKALETLFEKMQASKQAKIAHPMHVRRIPDTLPYVAFKEEVLSQERETQGLTIPIGYELLDATIFALDLTRKRGVLAFGKTGSGKTNFLACTIDILATLYKDACAIFVIEPLKQTLEDLKPEVFSYVHGKENATALLKSLTDQIENTPALWKVICIDDIHAQFLNTLSQETQEALLALAEQHNVRFICTGDHPLYNETTRISNPFLKGIRENGDILFIRSAPQQASDIIAFNECGKDWGEGIAAHAVSANQFTKIKLPLFEK